MQLERFKFELAFDQEGKKAEVQAAEESERRFEEARVEAHKKGFEEGSLSVKGGLEAELDRLVREMSNQLGLLADRFREVEQANEENALRAAFLIASRLAPSLMAAEPEAEIKALIAQCLTEYRQEPRLLIRVNEAMVDQISAHAEAVGKQSGFEGDVIVVGNPDASIGDCLVEWADGGIERNPQTVAHKLEKLIRGYMSSGKAPEPADRDIPSGPDSNDTAAEQAAIENGQAREDFDDLGLDDPEKE